VGTVSVGSQGKLALNLREAGSERACGARANHNQQGRKPLRHLGMSRGDERGVCTHYTDMLEIG
jgi:hypothetical protein